MLWCIHDSLVIYRAFRRMFVNKRRWFCYCWSWVIIGTQTEYRAKAPMERGQVSAYKYNITIKYKCYFVKLLECIK